MSSKTFNIVAAATFVLAVWAVWLAGSSDLISIRSRGSERREFDYIMAIRRKAASADLDNCWPTSGGIGKR